VQPTENKLLSRLFATEYIRKTRNWYSSFRLPQKITNFLRHSFLVLT